MIDEMRQLIDLIDSKADDHETLEMLRRMTGNPELFRNGKDVFDRVREKTLRAERQRDAKRYAQYLFEEFCAKALYNCRERMAPFDPDSAFWVIRCAFSAARELGIDRAKVLEIIDGPNISELFRRAGPYQPRG